MSTMVSNDLLVLYVFHNRPGLTANRLIHLSLLNSELKIVALYGGPPNDFERTVMKIRERTMSQNKYFLNNIDFAKHQVSDPRSNHDLLAAYWFRNGGSEYSFDVVAYIEYDVLMLDGFDKVYPQESSFDLALPWLTDSIRNPNWYWLATPHYKRLLNWRKDLYGISTTAPVLIGFFPIYLIRRATLERYCQLCEAKILPDVFGELRLPNIVSLLGGKLCELDLTPTFRWRPTYTLPEIRREVDRMDQNHYCSTRAFHPVYSLWHF